MRFAGLASKAVPGVGLWPLIELQRSDPVQALQEIDGNVRDRQ